MVDIGGTFNDRVNTRSTKLFVRPAALDIEWVELQDKELRTGHPVSVEPTTSAGVAGYSGAVASTLTGTLLFTTDVVAAVGGFTELNTTVNNNVPIKTWKLKLTDFGGTTQIWEVQAMLEDFGISGPAEGGTKFDILLRILTDPIIT